MHCECVCQSIYLLQILPVVDCLIVIQSTLAVVVVMSHVTADTVASSQFLSAQVFRRLSSRHACCLHLLKLNAKVHSSSCVPRSCNQRSTGSVPILIPATIHCCGAQAIDTLALNLQNKWVFPHCLAFAADAIQSGDSNVRAAACTVLVVVAEGCCDACTSHLAQVLQVHS